MEPKYVEPKPKRKMEPKSMEPKEPKSQLKDDPRINQILLKLEQQELERKLFHFDIREMVKEWKQSISEIKQTLSKLASKNQVPIVFYKKEKNHGKLTTKERKRSDGNSYYI